MTTDLIRINALIQSYKLIDPAEGGWPIAPGWRQPGGKAGVELSVIAALFNVTNPSALGDALAAGGYCLSRDRSKVNLSLYRWKHIQRTEKTRAASTAEQFAHIA